MAEANNDWNDLNPWVEGNEWNAPPAGYTGTPGGQVVAEVADGTWPGDSDYHVEGAVAYSINCHDSPKEYNDKMEEQEAILDYLIRNRKLGYGQSPNLPAGVVLGWDRTTAPPSKTDPHGGGVGVWASYAGQEVVAPLDRDTSAPAGVKTASPYRPGYSSEWYARSKATWLANIATAMRQSAGVDCVGLVQRAAGYGGNRYTLPEVGKYTWATADPSAGRVTIDGSYLTTVSARDPGGDEPENLDKVIPGDIVYYPGHVLMVAEVKSAAGRAVRMADVLLMEAVIGDIFGARTDRVVAVRNLADLNAVPCPWKLGRPIRSGGLQE